MIIEIPWSDFKDRIDNNNLKWVYTNESNNYATYASYNGFILKCYLRNGSSDYTDFETNWKALGDLPVQEIDDEGRQVHRPAYGKKGWTYTAHPVEFTTAKDGAIFSEDWQGNDRGDYVFKFYKADGTEIVDAGGYADKQAHLDAECVETRITVKPDYDYEIIAGKLDIHTIPTTDIRMWVVGGVIDDTTQLPWEYPTGVYNAKEFAGGINFKYVTPNKEIETDGRASKFMAKTKTGVPYQTNQFLVIMRHDAGIKHDFMLTLEYFRA